MSSKAREYTQLEMFDKEAESAAVKQLVSLLVASKMSPTPYSTLIKAAKRAVNRLNQAR